MSIIAAVGGHGGGVGVGGGGGSGPQAPYLASIVLSGPTQGVATYPTAAYTASGFDQNGASFALTPIFASSATGVATINSGTGVATPVANGTTSITAHATNSLGQVITSNAITLQVQARAVTTVTITGPTSVVAGQQTAAYVATALDQNGATMAGQTFVWSSSATGVATINSGNAIATGVAAGSTTIRATCAGVQSNGITLTVAARVVTTIQVSGPTSVIVTHATAAYSATALDQAGATMTGQTFTWQTSDATKATITSGGIASGIAAGTPNITAKIGSVTSNAVALTVQAQVPTGTITVSPSSFTVASAGTQQLTATVRDQGTPANILAGATVTWDTADHSKATVNGSGLVTGVAAGATTVTATSGAATGTSAATVTSATGSINSTPSSLTLTVGTPNAVVIRDNNSNIVTDLCTFSSSNPSVVYVDFQPTLTGLSPSVVSQGDTNVTLTLTGTNFTSAALGQSVAITPSTGLTLGATTFVNATTITQVITAVSGAATVGGRSVTVVDSGHGTTAAQTLTIKTPGSPTVPVTTGRVLHLMADAGTSTTTDGAAVASWTDQSATAAVFSGIGGQQPTYVAVSQAGLPGLQFDGANDVLTAASVIAGLNSASGVALFTVARRVSGSGNALLFANNDINANTGFGVGATSALSIFYGTGMTTSALSDPSNLDTAVHQVTWVMNPGSGSAKQQIIRDGTVVATGTDVYGPGSTVAPTVGALNVPAGYAGDWIIYEVLAYNLAVNPNVLTTQLASILNYLKSKWGTP